MKLVVLLLDWLGIIGLAALGSAFDSSKPRELVERPVAVGRPSRP